MKVATTFKILHELEYHYLDNGDIYLMLIKTGDRYCVELSSRSEFIGRKIFSTKRNAEKLIDTLDCSLRYQLFYGDCKAIIEYAFLYKNMRSALFALMVCKNYFTYKEHNELRKIIPFTSIFAYKNEMEEITEQPSEIIITLKGDSHSIGSFLKIEDGTYWFNFSTDYE